MIRMLTVMFTLLSISLFITEKKEVIPIELNFVNEDTVTVVMFADSTNYLKLVEMQGTLYETQIIETKEPIKVLGN